MRKALACCKIERTEMFNYLMEQLSKPVSWLMSNNVLCPASGDGTERASAILFVFPPLKLSVNNLIMAVFKDSQKDFGHFPSSSFFCYLLFLGS